LREEISIEDGEGGTREKGRNCERKKEGGSRQHRLEKGTKPRRLREIVKQ